MNRSTLLALTALAAACAFAPTGAAAKLRAAAQRQPSAIPRGLLIAPGHAIGLTPLGHHGAAALAKLPPPDASDVGMSQQRLVWISKTDPKQSLYIHTVANGVINAKPTSGVTIDEIRVTSPEFRIADGLGSGSALAAIRKHFPHIRPSSRDGKIYDDPRAGVAFEFAAKPKASSRCIAIIVHPRDRSMVEGAGVVKNIVKGGRG